MNTISPRISLIVAMTRNRVIGRDNAMPWHLPADLEHFRQKTLGKPVIMGRRTFESIGKPLPRRTNIVITRNETWSHPGTIRSSDLQSALAAARDSPQQDRQNEIMVIGGSQIYAEAMPLCHRIYLTRIEAEIDGDAFFAAIDPDIWKENDERIRPADPQNPYDLTFLTLDRIQPP